MGSSSRKWSEADYAANVYVPLACTIAWGMVGLSCLCTATMSFEALRYKRQTSGAPILLLWVCASNGDWLNSAQCPIALPQPLPVYRSRVKPSDVRILSAKTACPDGSVFVPKRALTHLMGASGSAFNKLTAMTKGTTSPSGSVGGKTSFRYQATPCTTLSDGGGFEFVSSFWEDKKHEHIDAACRQNRMATASAVRQLHALRIRAPVFGLVWAQGTVRAHVDWWEEIEVVDDNGREVTVSGHMPSIRWQHVMISPLGLVGARGPLRAVWRLQPQEAQDEPSFPRVGPQESRRHTESIPAHQEHQLLDCDRLHWLHQERHLYSPSRCFQRHTYARALEEERRYYRRREGRAGRAQERPTDN